MRAQAKITSEFPFFETVRIEDSSPCNLTWHQARMDKTLAYHYHTHRLPPLETMFHDAWLNPKRTIPEDKLVNLKRTPQQATVIKWRVLYNNLKWESEFVPYKSLIIASLLIVEDPEIDYSFKYCDRENINKLYALKGGSDDILIVRNGLITDTSIANIIFRRGEHCYTPSTPLLRGTCRERLIAAGVVEEAPISVKDLTKYSHFMLVNAMNDYNEKRWLPIENIYSYP